MKCLYYTIHRPICDVNTGQMAMTFPSSLVNTEFLAPNQTIWNHYLISNEKKIPLCLQLVLLFERLTDWLIPQEINVSSPSAHRKLRIVSRLQRAFHITLKWICWIRFSPTVLLLHLTFAYVNTKQGNEKMKMLAHLCTWYFFLYY